MHSNSSYPCNNSRCRHWSPLSSSFYIQGNHCKMGISSYLNPMDRGAWWAAVRGIAKSRTRLSDFTFTFHFPALEKEMAPHSSVLAWRIPGTGEPGGLPSMGSHRVGLKWLSSSYLNAPFRKWQSWIQAVLESCASTCHTNLPFMRWSTQISLRAFLNYCSL